MNKNICTLLTLGILIISLSGCSKKKKDSSQTNQPPHVVPYETVQHKYKDVLDVVPYAVVQDKALLKSYYEIPDIKEWYKEGISPPAFDYTVDLSKKSYRETRLLRNEIYARNGYLFNDACLRGYFNQFKWYQPVFEVPDYKLQLDSLEDAFVQKALQREKEAIKERYVAVGNDTLINMEHVENLIQFKEVNSKLFNALQRKNFALAQAAHKQLFYVYDKNQYQYIPNFYTTDLYLQVLHKYLSGLLQKIEEEKMVNLTADLVENLLEQSKNIPTYNTQIQSAAKWANTYLAIAYTLISTGSVDVDTSLRDYYDKEVQKVLNAAGGESSFLNRKIFDYSQFKPRGNYTKTDKLENYFRCMKWLNSAPINISDNDRFGAALLIAWFIMHDQTCQKEFFTLNTVIQMFAGEEDNLSISRLIKIIKVSKIENIKNLLTPQTFKNIRQQLAALDVDRIQPEAGNDLAREEFLNKYILFTAGRYTFDAEIFSRLIHVLRPEPKRPFPRGLDVFAVLGNEQAKSILIGTYKETEKWPEYSDSLALLTNQFNSFNDWNFSVYNKTMECIQSLNIIPSINYPLFMKTQVWQKKNLQTSLAAWAELKHDMILYTEQPFAAECGQGGGPPPPRHISYVEPNIAFWKKTIELLDFQKKKTTEIGVMPDYLVKIQSDLINMATFLLAISEKEIKRETISDEEFDKMSWLGGEVESLTFRIMESDHLSEREKDIALVADVYTYNQEILEVAVGQTDEIYVIAEINGLPYLSRGACLSYYEFKHSSRLTDEEWQEMLKNNQAPDRPEWLEDIYVKTNSLESKPEYSF